MTTNQERADFLRARLFERDVVIEEVWDYLILQHPPHPGMQMQALAEFVDTPDLQSFWWFYDWWAPVKDKPKTLPTPTIIQFCWYINHTPGTPAVTFDEALRQTYERCLAHCVANDLDPVYPGETADERTRRRNRERMAKTRGHRKVPEKDLKHNEALTAQVRGLEGQVAVLKQDSKDAEEQLKQEVKRHQDAMNDAAQRKRECIADYKMRIDAIQQEIRSLISKQ